jgi:heme a synthase
VSTATTAGSAGTIPDRDRLALRRWLFASIVAVFLAVAIGGITRLTESGLSITEWKPVSGALPPSSDAAWQVEYEKFLQIPQASTTHAGITLGKFKWIFWWEWFHRNVARTVGLVFAIPWLLFMAQGRIPKALRLRLTALPFLTLAQGALGWYMVQSGLVERISVSAYRLTAHLGLALGILAVCVWTYSELRPPTTSRSERETPRPWRRGLLGMSLLLGITVLSGVRGRAARRPDLQRVPAHGRTGGAGGLRTAFAVVEQRLRESDRGAVSPSHAGDRRHAARADARVAGGTGLAGAARARACTRSAR